MKGQFEKVFDFEPAMSNEELLSAVTQMKRPKRRANGIVVTALIAVMLIALCGTAYATGLFNVIMVTPIPQPPAEGYTDVDGSSELMSVLHEFDGERGSLEFYVSTHSLEESDGKYTLNNVAMANARAVLLKPKDSEGFALKEGETLSLYALLDITPEYADKSGQMVQIGYSLDGVLYETFSGKLTGGGMTFEITAPVDGEFTIFVLNASMDLQNYTELTVTLDEK